MGVKDALAEKTGNKGEVTEGETGRSEGGESYSFDNAPRQIYDVLNRFRLARVGGRTYETKTKQT